MITLLILYLLILKGLRQTTHRRYDGSPAFPYCLASDFGVEEERFSFFSGKWKLSGSRYFIKGGKPRALVVFFHGIGSGRNAYLKMICQLAQQGLLVYAFDYTGSMESEGPSIYGLGHVVKDQAAFFHWLDQDPMGQGLERYAIGHSWGGYAALMAAKPEYHVKKIISLSGFVRPSNELLAVSGHPNNKLIGFLLRMAIKQTLGKSGDISALDVLRLSDAKVFYIQGTNDTMVPPASSGSVLKDVFSNNPSFSFLDVQNAGHSPYLSFQSDQYIQDLLAKGLNSPNDMPDLRMDLKQATEDNPAVMKAIFDFFS